MSRRAFLLGPTASGKTAVAAELAPLLGAEVLSMDSMLVYRGMDIGTAKPAAAERAAVRHHLLDLVEPDQPFSVARWLREARAAEAEVAARGAVALYAGGTGLYLRALAAGLHDGPPVPREVRAAVAAELRAPAGRERLREELRRGDPALHARLHPADEKRLLRGIETLRFTGRPLSAWQTQWDGRRAVGAPAVALAIPRENLRTRVEERFDAMLAAGFLDEVRRIRATTGFGPTAQKALGYRQLLEHLEGRCTLEQARARAIAATRTLIRRQMTWLRSFPDIRWIEAQPDEPRGTLARRALEVLLHG